jgi:ClpP class serine protease
MGILGELDLNASQHAKRVQLIERIEEKLTARYGAANRVFSYIIRLGHPRGMISSADFPSFETTIASLAGAEQVNLILHGPGGDGTIAEKMVEMARCHCSGERRKFRVIVPNIAKSAATILALGADTLLMGYCSELGPIDPQLFISVSGSWQQVSAQSFLDARDELMAQVEQAVREKRDVSGYLQQLASLNIPFTKECKNLIQFSRQTAIELLGRYMLRQKFADEETRKAKATEIAEKLLSKELFPVHGQFIDGATARDKLDLEVEILEKEDELWRDIWEYYMRCEVQMNVPLPQMPQLMKIKLFESRQVSLVTPDVPIQA